MPAGIQAYSPTGELVFDSNTHRLIRFVRTQVATWQVVSGTNNRVWRCNVDDIDPKNTYVSVSGVNESYVYVGGVQATTWGSRPPDSSTLTIYRF